MLLSERLAENVRACFTGIWIQSHEHDEALLEMSRLCHSEDWRLLSWDIDRGLQGTELAGARDTSLLDPLAAIHCLSSQADSDRSTLLVLKNFHRFINSPEIIQALTQQINLGKQARTFIV
ncbi:MAG TPA: AAA family ATPase, partial [Planctomycetaceae bacterium]|nr:AAA family ATPase [Planctomycetaceae bacterium]